MGNILGDDSLKLLRTKRNYKKFDEEYGTCKGVMFYPAATEELSDFGGFPLISDKILKAVCYVYNESKTSNFDDDTCNFLYFWLGNMLFSNLKDTKFVSEVIIRLYQRLNENPNQSVCDIPHISMQEKDFQRIKLIFDYSQDYYNYKLDLASYNPPCNGEYRKYLTTYVDNYKHLYKECIEQNQRHSYCTEFLKYYDVTKHGDLYSWKCNLTETLSKAQPSEREAENKERQAQLGLSSGRGGVEQPLQQTYETAQVYQGIPNPLSPYPKMPEEGIVSTTPDGTSPTIISKSVTGAVSVAGALVPSYLLYNVMSIMFNKHNALH
ncbi:hypothetical protein PVIIG_06345 [Plasmodium vivax India VII]|uniref:Variable surface protein Vir7-like protein n=1 Tax=Plasmodium vivax India VII TaxID=1077284 RepID=A0A0J9S361_PLAVI|nr:hypothetical protein PVIIG_06345 [Plasmodium vivax India VII]